MNFETADGLHVAQVLRLKAVPLWAGTLRKLKAKLHQELETLLL